MWLKPGMACGPSITIGVYLAVGIGPIQEVFHGNRHQAPSVRHWDRGSISFVGSSRTDYINYSYDGIHLTIQELLDRVPEINDFADVRCEQYMNVGSTDVGPDHWVTGPADQSDFPG